MIFKRTKIIATIGPASSSLEKLTKLFQAGMNVARINMSHGNHDIHLKTIKNIRSINKTFSAHIGILADLQGPKIRIAEVENDKVILTAGNKIRISNKEQISNEEILYITYKDFPKDVSKNELILLDDGKLQLKVLSTNKKDEVIAQIIYGGELSSNKGVNLPNTKISTACITEKDYADLDFALENEIEWIGLSFVRKASDIVELKNHILKRKSSARVVAKIEKPEAIENIDSIIEITDAIMVARGDLGVELPMEEVPVQQKLIVRKCLQKNKPVIIATQMMESMITNPRPTRAEANDVANSVLDGADAVMLSAETSVGKYPLESVQAMSKIIMNVEKDYYKYGRYFGLDKNSKTFLSDNICNTACVLSEQINAKVIVSMTHSGYTAFRISSHRCKAQTVIFTSNKSLLNTLSLIWGTHGFYYDRFESTDGTITDVNEILKKEKFVKKGDVVINTASLPIAKKTRTNMLKFSVVE